MNKKIMILGASVLQLPAILKAKEMGITVIAVDMDENAVGFSHANVCEVISTIDIEKVLECAKKYNIDGIMTLASDMPMRTIAVVANELGLNGISEDTALKATNKAKMREVLQNFGVPVPKFYCVNSFNDYINTIANFTGRFIVKPADNSGSRGIYLVQDKKDIKYAFDYSKKYSRNGDIVIEDFMQGDEVSVETLTINGETHIIAVTDKLTTGAPNFVEMGHSQPSKFTGKELANIEEVAKKAIEAIGIVDGPSHTEIMVTQDGAKIVELGARLGGDNITTHLVPLSTGVDMVECCINIALGLECTINKNIHKSAAIRYFKTKAGTLTNIEIPDIKINGVKEITFTRKNGDKVSNINSSTDRIGYVIAQAIAVKDAINICQEVANSIKIEVS